jgi:hypothetical protein
MPTLPRIGTSTAGQATGLQRGARVCLLWSQQEVRSLQERGIGASKERTGRAPVDMRLRRQAAYSLGVRSSTSLCTGRNPKRLHGNRSLRLTTKDTNYSSCLGSRKRHPRQASFKVSNQTRGAVMAVLKESDAKNHRSFGRNKGLPALRPVIRSGRTGCSTIKPELIRENTTPFAEDFYWEHFSSSASVALMAIPASSDSVWRATPRNHHANNINSPNCVYVG